MKFGIYLFVTLMICLCFYDLVNTLPVEKTDVNGASNIEKRFCIFRCNKTTTTKSSKTTTTKASSTKTTTVKTQPTSTKKTIEQVAQDVIDGKYGVGEDRKKRLEAEGYNYSEVQSMVNQILSSGSNNSTPKKTLEQVAQDVIDGKYGVGEDRKKRLEAEGYNYKEVQAMVNQLLSGTTTKTTQKTTTVPTQTPTPGTSYANLTTALEKIEQSIFDNWKKPYSYKTGYRCDNWVEEVIDDVKLDSSRYLKAGKAALNTVQDHITKLVKDGKEGVDYTKTLPSEDGAYVVFMGDGKINGKHAGEHAAILIVKDGNKTMYDNSSGNGGEIVYEKDENDKDTTTVSYYKQGVGKTENIKGKNGDDTKINGWIYNTYYYQKIELL